MSNVTVSPTKEYYSLLGVSPYIDISVYRNTQRIYILSQYEIRIAIVFFLSVCLSVCLSVVNFNLRYNF